MRILLIYGGEGSEHDVSKMGARNVLAAFSDFSFPEADFIVEVETCKISRNGKWSRSFDEILRGNFDVIFPLIHGRGGEDGAIAVLGGLLHIPVVGCDNRASQIAWDKDLCKIILAQNDIPVVPWKSFRRGDKIPKFAEISRELSSEILFIKPAREGSSVGVSRVSNSKEFARAIDLAFKFDDKILIEKAISGRELECAVLGNLSNIKTTDVGEIKPPENDFYTYDQKYSDASQTNLDIPAQNLPDEIRAQIRSFSEKAFRAIGGRGLARIDFFYDEKSGQVFLNEINTMPGFTNISMYPKLWAHAGLSYPKLLEKLVRLAL